MLICPRVQVTLIKKILTSKFDYVIIDVTAGSSQFNASGSQMYQNIRRRGNAMKAHLTASIWKGEALYESCNKLWSPEEVVENYPFLKMGVPLVVIKNVEGITKMYRPVSEVLSEVGLELPDDYSIDNPNYRIELEFDDNETALVPDYEHFVQKEIDGKVVNVPTFKAMPQLKSIKVPNKLLDLEAPMTEAIPEHWQISARQASLDGFLNSTLPIAAALSKTPLSDMWTVYKNINNLGAADALGDLDVKLLDGSKAKKR